VADETGWYTHWISVQRDITERKLLEAERERILVEKLRHVERERALVEALDRADRDPLTNLLNHRAFHERLTCESGKPCAIVVIDLDNFKFFNDVYGHLAGDEVLRQITRALQESCHTDADALSRFGGDEFGVLLPGKRMSMESSGFGDCATI
jgi:GGDEF domain-containing protein